MTSNLSSRQHATVLAALRHWQRHQADNVGLSENPIPEDDIATDGGTLQPLRSDEIDLLIEHLQSPDLTWECVAAANGWRFQPSRAPDAKLPGLWRRNTRPTDNLGTNGAPATIYTANAQQACRFDNLSIGQIPTDGEFDVMVQQYVEQIATIRVRATDIEDAIGKAYESDPGVSANWRSGAGAEKVAAWAVVDHNGATVWERS